MKKIIVMLLVIINFGIITNTKALEIRIITGSSNTGTIEQNCAMERISSMHAGRAVSKSCRERKSLIEELKSWTIPLIKLILTIGFATILAFGMGKSADRISEEKSWNLRFLNLLLFFLLLATAIATLIFDWLFIKYGAYWWVFIITLLYFSAWVLRTIFLDYKLDYEDRVNNKVIYNPQSKNKPTKDIDTNTMISKALLSAYLKEDLLILAKYYKVKFCDKDTKNTIREKIITEVRLKLSKNELFSTDKRIIFGFFKDLKFMYSENRTRYKFNFKNMIAKVESYWSKL